MENIIFIIILYFLGTLVSDQTNRNKRRKRRKQGENDDAENFPDFEIPPLERDNSFEIPKLEGAPKTSSDGVYREEDTKVSNKYLDYLNSGKKKSDAESPSVPAAASGSKKEPLVLTRENVRTGIILAEILNNPKAYRRLRR